MEHSGRIQILGIDPAPQNNSAVLVSVGEAEPTYQICKPSAVRPFLEDVASSSPAIIAWDAPLSFDPRNGLYIRPIEKQAQRVAAILVSRHVIEPSAVNTLAFAGCPHWTISCSALGMPFGQRLDRSAILATPRDFDGLRIGVLEVHPALTMALW
jgi:hypothetical protein